MDEMSLVREFATHKSGAVFEVLVARQHIALL
jgi:hypothetical protein